MYRYHTILQFFFLKNPLVIGSTSILTQPNANIYIKKRTFNRIKNKNLKDQTPPEICNIKRNI